MPLYSLAKNPSHPPAPFQKASFAADFNELPAQQQAKVAANLAERARNAEIERDGYVDMGISIGADATAVLTAALITGRNQAKRDRMITEWVNGGAAEAGKDLAEYPEPFYSGSEERNPVGPLNGLLRWGFLVPIVFFVGSAFEWQGRRYAREGGFASMFYVLGDMLRENVYNRRTEALEKEAQEAIA